jgi:ribosomal-protein-alanine N-acetyltransferase
LLLAAGPADAPLLAAIHAACFPPAERWDADALATQIGLPGAFGLLHPEGGMALGRVAADEAEILTLAVLPQARRRGVGAALLRAAHARAASAGARRMFLEVAASNASALTLYAGVGYRPVGHRRGYYADGGDAAVLACAISVAAAAAG